MHNLWMTSNKETTGKKTPAVVHDESMNVTNEIDEHAFITKKARHPDRERESPRHVSDPCLSAVPL